TRSAGMENAGGYCGKKSVRDFVERRWRSNGGWMEATGCATGAAICTCGTAPKRCGRPQVLAAYGLQDLRNKHRNPKTKSNPNTMCLPNTLGEDLGSGHFYLAKNRTFLLCVDRRNDPHVYDGFVLMARRRELFATLSLRAHGKLSGAWGVQNVRAVCRGCTSQRGRGECV